MKIVNEMPKSGKFVALWKHENGDIVTEHWRVGVDGQIEYLSDEIGWCIVNLSDKFYHGKDFQWVVAE